MVYDYDVVVIGAGPIGGYLSRKLSEHDNSVLLVEEHAEIGRPFQCAGLVNPGAMSKVNLEETALTRIWGARLHSPSGNSIEIGNPDITRTWSVCRKLFDEKVVIQSVESGTDLWLSSSPLSAEIKKDYVEMIINYRGNKRKVRTKLLCGADGAHSWVRRNFKMGRPKEMMIGLQIEVTGYKSQEGRLELFTGNKISPGFFSWAIPSGETTRIGVWSKPKLLGNKSCEDFLEQLMNDSPWKERFVECKEVGRFCGPVPSGILKKTMIERIALFGDAAGICKPTTGGGIGPGFKQVDILVPLLSKAIKDNDLSKRKMAQISLSLNEMKRDQRRKRALRDAFLTEVSEEELNTIFDIWSRPEVIQLINELGDIENPIPLGIKMLKDVPEFRKYAKKAAMAILWG